MGDRVLFQVIGKGGEFSPVVYAHWSGSRAPEVCKALKARMATRPGDVQYTAARLVQELVGDEAGALSFGIWNAKKVLTADDSHGDAGVVLIDVDGPMTFQCLGGYLVARSNGTVGEAEDAELESLVFLARQAE